MATWAKRLPPLRFEPPVTPTDESAAADRERSRELLWRMARTLQRFGVPAHRLEQALDVLADRLRVQGEFVVTPTFIIGALDGQAAVTRVHNEGTDLKRLIALHRLMRDLIQGEATVAEAEARLDAIEADRPRSVAWKEIVGYGLVAAAGAVLFDGGLIEIGVAASLGLGLGALLLMGKRSPGLGLLLPTLAGLLASAATSLVSSWLPIHALIPTLALLIPFLPGLTLTLAASELAHQHLISGGARMAGALMTLAQLGFGVMLGTQLVSLWRPAVEPAAPATLPAWAVGLALVASVLLFAARNRARSRDLGFVLAAATVSLTVGRASAAWIGPELGACLTAWLITTLGYAASRRFDIPSVVFLLPGLLLLVPGVLGFKSLSSLLQNDAALSVEYGLAMVRLALALVMGLLLANVTSRPREIF